MTPLVAIGVAVAGAVVSGAARGRPRAAWAIAVGTCSLAFAAAVAAAASRGSFQAPWVPAWGATVALEADPLGSLLAILAAAIGLLVVLYSGPYLRHHLEKHGRSADDAVRYYVLILLFLASMLGLAYAADLLLLFLFFDLTAVWSYFLIAYDRERGEARVGALTALLVTGSASVALLAAALLWRTAAGTFELAGIVVAPLPGLVREWAAALALVAALAKSAQVPFHFWLPRAMAAPTPVSAYLHSAAMVAGGVFVLLRLHPLLEGTGAAAVLPWLGLTSILVGSVLALSADRLKELLAYSTIAQYGYVVLLIGLGGSEGLAGAALYLAVHALAKSALFLTAGAVGQEADAHALSEIEPGLLRRMPWVAGSSALAAATLAGLAPTLGYFKDEILFQAALAHGPLFTAAATVGAALTVAYTARFWLGTFVGTAGETASVRYVPGPRVRTPPLLVVPIVLLAAACTLGVADPAWASAIASSAGTVAALERVDVHVAFSVNAALALAVLAWAGGVGLYLTRARWMGAALSVRGWARRFGPQAAYERTLDLLNRASSRVHALEVRDLRDRLASILIPAGVLVFGAFFAVVPETRWRTGALHWGHLPLLPALVALGTAAVAAPMRRTHLGLVLALSGVGYTLAGVYALLGAPELALVAVLVETVFTILLLAAFGAIPRETLGRELHGGAEARSRRVQERRHRWAGVLGGAAAFVVTWAALSVQDEGGVAAVHEAAADYAHAPDPVSAILADFRGLDTAGEVTVLALALLGSSMLLARREER